MESAEAILQQRPKDLEPKEPKDNSPKLFLEQPVTKWPKINRELIKAQELHVKEMDAEQVELNIQNIHRLELLVGAHNRSRTRQEATESTVLSDVTARA